MNHEESIEAMLGPFPWLNTSQRGHLGLSEGVEVPRIASGEQLQVYKRI